MKMVRRTLLFSGLVGVLSLSSLPAHADEKGDKILRQAFEKLHQARTLTADLMVEVKMTGQPTRNSKGTITLKKPNQMRVSIDTVLGKNTRNQLYLSDGKSYFNYAKGAPSYMKETVAATPNSFGGEWEGEVDSFFGGTKNANSVKADYAGTETVQGVVCDLVRTSSAGQGPTTIYAIGQKDHLIYRTTWVVKVDEKTEFSRTNLLKNIKLNATVSPSLFAFTPPAGIKQYDPAEEMRRMESKLVRVGEEAPAFELTHPQTKERFSLAKSMDGRKAVLVNFWFYG